jgi:hypothetical protein
MKILGARILLGIAAVAGVAFYGFDDGDPGTPDLIAAAERLGLEVYPSASKPKSDGTGEIGGVGNNGIE